MENASPDCSGVAIHRYNRDDSLKKKTNQRQTVLEYTYNERRQRVLEAATSLGGADSHVQAIGRTHDNIGRRTKVTSYGTDTVSTTIRNEVGRGGTVDADNVWSKMGATGLPLGIPKQTSIVQSATHTKRP